MQKKFAKKYYKNKTSIYEIKITNDELLLNMLAIKYFYFQQHCSSPTLVGNDASDSLVLVPDNLHSC